MRYVVLAVDYDGTLASAGQVAPETVHALERLASTGRRIILVTGRELQELITVFPGLDVFDRVVAENGAVLYTPRTGTRRTLGDPPPPDLVLELQRRGVTPLSVGRSIVATLQPHETTVLTVIRELGLELNVIFNKGAVMILPASLNKASGLKAALDELGLSPRNVVAIGDAENDYAMLRAAEFGVAVANALPTLKEEADRVSRYENGRAVLELIDDLTGHDLRETPPRVPRREILLGTRADGTRVRMPAAWFNVLVASPAVNGRSTLPAGMLERLAAEGYQFCAIDTTGDYDAMPDAIVLGAAGRVPAPADVITALHKPDANVVIDVGRMSRQARPAFVGELLRRVVEMRMAVGRPHWVLLDELEQLLPDGADTVPDLVTDAASGMLYVTAHPERFATPVLATVDLAIALGEVPSAALGRVAASWRVAAPDLAGTALGGDEALAWFRGPREVPFRFRIATPERGGSGRRGG